MFQPFFNPHLRAFSVILGLFACSTISSAADHRPVYTPTVPDVMKVSNPANAVQQNYPLQFGRPFMAGEIPNYPQILVDGAAILTQADVKNRYRDGSVKFAILSAVLPSIPAKGSLSLTFQDQPSGNNTPLSVDEMNAPAFDFDATVQLAGTGGTQTASAAAMLANGDYTYWTQGPVSTTVILADHLARKYDIGFDQYRPFRPIVHASFWPGINKVRVRFIGEMGDTEEFEDLTADLQLTTGRAAPSTVYQRAALTMTAGSRWTREYWIGGAPGAVNIDYNLPFLSATHYLPNYDASITIPESAIAANYTKWQGVKHDLYDIGMWQKAMASAGGRGDIGPYPFWMVQWFYTGDWRSAAVAKGMADLAAAWPMQFREARGDKKLDRAGTVSGNGRVISISTRPTISIAGGYTYSYTKPEDRIKVVGTVTTGGWVPDGAHQPDAFSVAYTLTGDYWYLEEMQMWAATTAARYNGAATNQAYGRGPTGAEGGIHDEVRGCGWVIRNRAQTAVLSPDGTPEKDYFTTLVNDALAIWEGERRIHGTVFQGTPAWNWAFKLSQQDGASLWNVSVNGKTKAIGPPPLQFWENNTGDRLYDDLNDGTNTIPVGGATSPWMQNYLIYSLGRVKELGFSAGTLLEWVGSNLVSQLTDPSYNRILTTAYHTPVMKADKTYFQNWAEVRQGFPLALQNTQNWPTAAAVPISAEAYPFLAMAAAAMTADLHGGDAAWANLREIVAPAISILTPDPRYAILPRAEKGGKPVVRR